MVDPVKPHVEPMWGKGATTSTPIVSPLAATATNEIKSVADLVAWTDKVAAAAPAPACAPVAAPATIQDALAGGAVPGTMLIAPLAPATGAIDQKAESLAIVTVKNFFDTPTWKAMRTVLQAAGGAVVLVLGGTFLTTWGAGKSIFDAGAVNWHAVEVACEVAGGGVIVTAVMGWAKIHDNNPTSK
jgi:hypothetical protein